MPGPLPPSQERVRRARALGVRPSSTLLVLAGIALGCAALLELAPVLGEWLSDQLRSALGGGSPRPRSGLAGACGVLLLGLLGGLVMAIVLVGSRRRGRARLRVEPEAAMVPGSVLVVVVAVGVVLVVALNLGLVAGAARAVDASGEGLQVVWFAWLRRALLSVCAVAAGGGVIERLLSARRLWVALHYRPERMRRD